MNYLTRQIVFQEVPDEISLSYLITGCNLRCQGCHSSDSWSSKAGQILTEEQYILDLKKHANWITCVLFMGGEWHSLELLRFLEIAQEAGFKTALYTGSQSVSETILEKLDYLKTGPYIQHLGGLSSTSTNQKLIEVKTRRILNSLFLKNENVQNGGTK